MPNYQKILTEVLKQIKPKPEEKKRLVKLAKIVLRTSAKISRRYKAKVILAGSLTRDTWLPGKKEFDVFIAFPEKLTEKKLEELGLKVGKDVFTKLGGSYRVEYAQHPYTSGNIEDVEIDVVPCYDVKDASKLKSAVDRTPFHVKYIEKNLKVKMADEVRLLKQFLTANHIYGADNKTEGFSGYVCELLVIRYKGFANVLKAAAQWKVGEIIDLQKVYAKKDFPELWKKFKDQVLILIDPTDKDRNTAAAISATGLFRFKKLAKEFLSKPLGEMFFERKLQPLNERELIEKQLQRRTELILVSFNPPAVVPDVLWPQMRRFADRLQSILEETEYEFKVLRKDVYTNEKDLAVVLLEMEVSKLPIVQKRVGPKIFDFDDSKRFLEKYKQPMTGPFIENNFWAVELRRKFLSAREKLFDSLNREASVLKAKGVPNNIAGEVAKWFEIISDNSKIMEMIKKDNNFGIFLRKYFGKESLA